MATSSDKYRPLPDYLTIKKSKIEGLGLFATQKIDKATVMGITHVTTIEKEFSHYKIRTPLGGFINHSDDPNCQLMDIGNNTFIETTREIYKGDEITLKYTMYEVVD